MEELSSRLKDLDALEIEKALQLLQTLKAQKQETGASAPAAVALPTDTEAPPTDTEAPKAVKEQEPSTVGDEAGQHKVGSETEAAPIQQCSPETFAGLPPEDVPFAFGELGIKTLKKEEMAPQKSEGKKKHRSKGLTSSSSKGKTLGSQEGTAQAETENGAAAKPERQNHSTPQGLASFGFFTTAPKATDAAKTGHMLFSPFVPDRRIVPHALAFWGKDGACPQASKEASAATVPDVCEAAPKNHFITFEEWVDFHRGGALRKPPMNNATWELDKNLTRRNSNVPEPYKGFNRETVYAGFFAIGYEPCQARPAYFGTHNNLQEGSVNGNELQHLGRFPLGEQMPRLSVLDYEYDSGDDWDAMDGGEDVCMSSSSDTTADDDSLASSDLDFVASDDEDDGGDSETELQRKIMEARQQRLRRLRGKDKLISSHSGPFVGIAPSEHPLRLWDRMDRLRSFADDALSEIFAREIDARVSGTNTAEEMVTGTLSPQPGGAIEAALKNRRNMSEEETMAMHKLIEVNRMISTKAIIEGFREKQMCVGVPRAEIERTVKRFYERKHGSLTLREEPWSASDARLFVKPVKKNTTAAEVPATPPDCPDSLTNTGSKEGDEAGSGGGDNASLTASATKACEVEAPQTSQTAATEAHALNEEEPARQNADTPTGETQQEEPAHASGTKRPREEEENQTTTTEDVPKDAQ